MDLVRGNLYDANICSIVDGVEGIPAGLDELEAGPVLAALLSTLEGDERSGYDRVLVLRAHQRMASYFQARV